MATEVTPLPRLKVAKAASTLTPEQKYWSSFSSQTLLPTPTSTPVTHISSNSPSVLPPPSSSLSLSNTHQPYIAITTGPRLQLLSPTTLKPLRTITRTTSPFHSAHVRRDGRLVLAGSDSGVIQAFDTSSRAILKTWPGEQNSKQPVWVTRWHPRDLTSAMSCGDDGVVKVWDLTSDRSVWQGYGHADYVRCGAWIDEAGGGGTSGLVASGSYDRGIRLWDPRIRAGDESTSGGSVMHFQLRDPVEAVLPMPGGTSLLGAAGEKVVVLDLVAARPLQVLRNHQKTVTSLALAGQGSKVFTGALDGHVKVFDTESWQVVAGFKYPSPVLAVDVVASGTTNREDRHLCVGMQSGLLSIRTRLSGAAKAKKREKEREMEALMAGKIEEHDRALGKRKRGKGWEKRFRGKDFTGEGADIIIDNDPRDRSRRTTEWETALRKGRYGAALDVALATGDKSSILTLLTALVHRSALRTALKDRNALTLLPLLRWLKRAIQDPRYVRLTSDTALVVLELYGENLGESKEVDQSVARLHEHVRQSVEVAQTSLCTLGMLDLLNAGETGG